MKESIFQKIQGLVKQHTIAEVVLVLLSGAGLGFLLWRMSIDSVTFNSYLFFNILSVLARFLPGFFNQEVQYFLLQD